MRISQTLERDVFSVVREADERRNAELLSEAQIESLRQRGPGEYEIVVAESESGERYGFVVLPKRQMLRGLGLTCGVCSCPLFYWGLYAGRLHIKCATCNKCTGGRLVAHEHIIVGPGGKR